MLYAFAGTINQLIIKIIQTETGIELAMEIKLTKTFLELELALLIKLTKTSLLLSDTPPAVPSAE